MPDEEELEATALTELTLQALTSQLVSTQDAIGEKLQPIINILPEVDCRFSNRHEITYRIHQRTACTDFNAIVFETTYNTSCHCHPEDEIFEVRIPIDVCELGPDAVVKYLKGIKHQEEEEKKAKKLADANEQKKRQEKAEKAELARLLRKHGLQT